MPRDSVGPQDDRGPTRQRRPRPESDQESK
jgi:hypothetical protein